MVKFKLKVEQEDFDNRREDSGDFVLPKPGVYVLTCVEAEPGATKDGDGNPDPSRPYIKFTYRITGVGKEDAPTTENYGLVWDYMSFSPASGFKRAEVAEAYGIATTGGEFDVDTDDLTNRKVLARIKHEKGREKDAPKNAKIARLFPYGTDIGADSGVDVDYGNSEDNDVFGGESDDAVEHNDPQAERRAELSGLDLKALGGVLKGLGGDPKEHIVKNSAGKLDNDATAAAVIDAIISHEAGETAPDAVEEDPF